MKSMRRVLESKKRKPSMNLTHNVPLAAIVFVDQDGRILIVRSSKEQGLLRLPEMSAKLIESPVSIQGLLFAHASDAVFLQKEPLSFLTRASVLRQGIQTEIDVYTARVTCGEKGFWKDCDDIDRRFTYPLLDAVLLKIE